MAPKGPAYHTDWVWSNLSNVHVANHSDWFVTFTPFDTFVTDIHFPDFKTPALGIGDVELDVKVSATRRGSKSHRKILLRNVLLVPKAVCNILGNPILKYFDLVTSWHENERSMLKDKRTGVCAGLIDNVRFRKLWLAGQPSGQTSLKPNTGYIINAVLPTIERDRWDQHLSLIHI